MGGFPNGTLSRKVYCAENNMSTNAWDSVRLLLESIEIPEEIFLALSEGEEVEGVLLGEPLPEWVVWDGEHYEVHQDQEEIPVLRIFMNFLPESSGAMKVLVSTPTFFREVLKARSQGGLGDLFQIRRGVDKSHLTRVGEIGEALRDRIAETPLHDLPDLL